MKLKSIKNINIKTKLLLLGGISIMGLIFMGMESVITARQINEASTEISQCWVPAIIIAEELNTRTSDYRIKEYNHVITTDKKDMDRLEEEMIRIREDIARGFKDYELYISSESDRKLMEAAEGEWNKYLEYSDRLLVISRQNQTQEAFDMIIGDSRQLFDDASSRLLKVADFNRKGSEAASIHGDNLYGRLAKIKIITICLISGIISLLVLYIIMAIDKPVKALVEGTRKVANGDLEVHLPYRSEDEIGILTNSVNQLIERLKHIIDDEKYLFREIGSENFEVKSTCEHAYRGDFAPILYSITGLMSRLDAAKKRKERGGSAGTAENEKEELAQRAVCREITKHGRREMDASDKKG
ncbi:MCP four helix bundle domain-containing protein [Lacrimispora sp. BS-2]|uniref:MCP four helix bundle domain-containing protein n=1 Tax=Lacrimispora sp. BS-2 TaxID=3151850 RepID=A0AAU7PNU5_9FIRM